MFTVFRPIKQTTPSSPTPIPCPPSPPPMSPRGASTNASSSSNLSNTRTSVAPYPRRASTQPKSSRQQFSACGACRMRRVRCDLKDLPIAASGPNVACSNCKERGHKCVDEYADVKAVKLLRRGRLLLQVEARYGKVGDNTGNGSSASPERPQSTIPKLSLEFFSSPFWRWLVIQHPLLDPNDFSARYSDHIKEAHPLNPSASLLAMVLVVWAASFGLDERGLPEGQQTAASGEASNSHQRPSSSAGPSQEGIKRPSFTQNRQRCKEKTTTMVRELLDLIDYHGLLRKPTWDGVRVLLLLLPLTDDIPLIERLLLHEATLSQARAISTLTRTTPSSLFHTQGLDDASDDTTTRARIFWYAYIRESVTTGLRGGRLVLNEDDLDMFQRTLPPFGVGGQYSSLPSPTSPTYPSLPTGNSYTRSSLRFKELFTIPLRLASVCRRIHSALVNPKAIRLTEDTGVIHGNLYEVWAELDRCWEDFEVMRQKMSGAEAHYETEQFIDAWMIFIFECHNLIRESLKLCMTPSTVSSTKGPYPISPSSRPSSSSSGGEASPHRLHSIATQKCYRLLPSILRLIQYHLDCSSRTTSGFFQWDSSLVRDGCFFAGFLSATIEGDIPEGDGYRRSLSTPSFTAEEGITLCLTALAEMKWAFSNIEEREDTLKMAWRNHQTSRLSQFSSSLPYSATGRYNPPELLDSYTQKSSLPYHLPDHHNPTTPDRLPLPPLILHQSPQRPGTGHSVAYSDGHGWPTYTPPGTGASIATNGTGGGNSPPAFVGIRPSSSYQQDTDDTFYHVDPFQFPTPMVDTSSSVADVPGYARTSSSHGHHSSSHSYQNTNSTNPYVNSTLTSVNSSIINGTPDACLPYGEGGQPYYPPLPRIPSC